MDSSFLFPPAKRSINRVTEMLDGNTPYAATPTSTNGASPKRSKPPQPPIIIPPGHVAFRLICHSSRIGGVIGKSGAVIKQLQQDTAAKIRVEDSPPGTDDRVIVVVASKAVNRKIALKASKEDQESSLFKDEETELSAAQEAVIRVFERILDVAAETDGLSVSSGGNRGIVSFRLLAESSQAGFVIGKGGKVIEKIREDTGCRIRVLRSEKLPACALPNDEMVEIEGNILSVKKALLAVSRRLQDCLFAERAKTTRSRPIEAIPQETSSDLRVDLPQRSSVPPPLPASSINYTSRGHPMTIEVETASTLESITKQEVVYRLLCSNDRVGGVIGKAGTIVRALENETGASISIGASLAECDERLVTITGMESPDSRHSPAQNAVVLVFNRTIEAGDEKGLDSVSRKGSPFSARLLVPTNQVGCLLGKGGAIVSEIRKVTGAAIRMIRDELPKCASESDEVVQITGEFVNVQHALNIVTGRLRDNLFQSRMPNGTSYERAETSPYERARDLSSLHKTVGVSYDVNSQTNLTQSMDQFGLSHNYDHPASQRLRASQQTFGGVNPRSMVDVGKGLTSFKGGIEVGSGSRSAIVTNTTVEIVIPENVVGSVYGENGSNLTRLRQISGAKVLVHEPHPGTADRILIISGTPDETQAAQSLLQAFILSGS